MERGQTLNGDGVLTILETSDTHVRVAERYVSDDTPHWHKFWMPREEIRSRPLVQGETLSPEAVEIVETLTDTHPKETPLAEERLISKDL